MGTTRNKRSTETNRNEGRNSGIESGRQEDDVDDDDDDDNDSDDTDDDDDDDDEVLTQAQVDKIVNRVKGKTRRIARRDLLKELGAESIDDLKELIAKANKPAAKTKTSDDDDEAKRGQAQADADAVRKASEKTVKELNLTRKIEGVLVDTYELTFKQAAAVRRLVEVDLEADEDEIEEALEDLEKTMPNLFSQAGAEDDDEDDTRKRSTRRGSKRTDERRRGRASDVDLQRSPRSPRSKGADPKAAARTLLHERHPQTRKSNN